MAKSYCRICGSEADHGFKKCQNVRGLRNIIWSQDDEIKAYLQRIKYLETELADSEASCKRVGELGANAERDRLFAVRIVEALLDGYEARRKETK